MHKQQMRAPQKLIEALQNIIPNCQLHVQQLPELDLYLWLITTAAYQQRLDDEVMQRIWNNTPYWLFCWASGLAMAQWLLAEPELVSGKSVLDFGAGSGVVAIAAKLAGASRVICCDIDAVSLQACRENAHLNQVQLEYCSDFAQAQAVDVLLAADVLYEPANHELLEQFLSLGKEVWVADSRVKLLEHPRYQMLAQRSASSFPDLGEAPEFRQVCFYHGQNI
jgi:predicted nicotinamide N-methyase